MGKKHKTKKFLKKIYKSLDERSLTLQFNLGSKYIFLLVNIHIQKCNMSISKVI